MNDLSPLAHTRGSSAVPPPSGLRNLKHMKTDTLLEFGGCAPTFGVGFTQLESPFGNGDQLPFNWEDDGKQVTSKQRTVLVVDDDQAIREALADVLGELGYNVVGASDGQQALDRLQEGCEPFVILLDLGMPVMDGWQFRKELLKNPRYAGLRVVVITASRDQRAEALQATEVLTKPVQLERLLRVLDAQGNNP